MKIESLSSTQNQKIKELILLRDKARDRRERGLFIVEGVREIKEAIKGGYYLSSLFFCKEISSPLEELQQIIKQKEPPPVFEVTAALYSKISYRGSTEGLIAIFQVKDHTLNKIVLNSSPLIIVVEGVEKPGNLGAILRTADAVGADAVIVCDPAVDLYNPNVVRASLGALFSVQIALTSTKEAINWLSSREISIITAQLQDSQPYYQSKMVDATALVFGSEAEGLSTPWRESSDQKIFIPMKGEIDSLNLSASVAILSYEALRQRECKL